MDHCLGDRIEQAQNLETYDPCENSVRALGQHIGYALHTAVELLGTRISPADARTLALVRTKLEEAQLWLGKVKEPTVGFKEDRLP